MALSVLSMTPADADNDVNIDSKIVIEFDGPIDPFTVFRGISVYCETENLWSGPDLAALDNKYRDVLEIGPDYAFYPVTYQITGNTVTITPQVSLMPDKTHYISVLPGNDAGRYISEPTTAPPVYLHADNLSDGTIEILSSYTGNVDGVLSFTFTDTDKIDVVLEGNYLGEYVYTPGEEVNIGILKFSVLGAWDINDSATIAVSVASGVSAIFKNKFVTSKYVTTVPTSIRIEEKLRVQSALHSLKVVGSMPHGLSVNNEKCNPIVMKFTQPIDDTQDFSNLIRISKTSLVTGRIKAVSFYVKAVGDTIKIYLASVDNNGIVDQAINIDDIVSRTLPGPINILE